MWWYRLEHVILQNERVTFVDAEQKRELATSTILEKETAFEIIWRIIRNLGPEKRDTFLAKFFSENPAGREFSARLMLDWADVKQLAADPLVTIGAHSVNHHDLGRLNDEQVVSELSESRRAIESNIGREVRHFAYPFGGANSLGAREFALAKACGFKTAVTTRGANLFPAHASHLECLPRIGLSGNYPPLRRFKLVHSGALAAFKHGFRRVVTD